MSWNIWIAVIVGAGFLLWKYGQPLLEKVNKLLPTGADASTDVQLFQAVQLLRHADESKYPGIRAKASECGRCLFGQETRGGS
jgi:hypothetical protein